MVRRRRVKRYVRRSFLMLLAGLFMLEAWLWDTTGAIVAHLLQRFPWQAMRDLLALRIAHLSPLRTLGLFIIPVLLLLPMKFFALWLLSQGSILGGMGVIMVAKLVGLGVSSFLFSLCKPKLLQLRWVAWLYHTLMRTHKWAKHCVRPYTALLKRYLSRLQRLRKQRSLFTKLREKLRPKILKKRKRSS